MEHNPLSDLPYWHSRRYIPHFDQPDIIQSVTIRLFDAVPKPLIDQWKMELRWTDKMPGKDPRRIALMKRIERYEDAGYGVCWLKDERIAGIVESSLLRFDRKRYRLFAWCIMPNHVHTVLKLLEDSSLGDVFHSLKSYTAHEANKVLHRSGKFWFREYFDRYIRDAQHFENVVAYVENNPVKAALVSTKGQWRWSSAREK